MREQLPFGSHEHPIREKIYRIIFEAETPAGRRFDILLIWAIVLSVTAVCLESIASIRESYGDVLLGIEWFFTILFTIEFVLRIASVKRPFKYIFSFYGLIDFLAILPTYVSLYITGVQSLLVIRSIRLIRIFRLFKLVRYVGEAEVLAAALRSSRHKITVFLVGVLSVVLFMGALMYLVEGEEHGFTSIPKAMYWAVVTMTTVGYGDFVPQTDLGRTFASILMIMGYGIIAVPTGIVSAEIVNATKSENTRCCGSCMLEGHRMDAKFCRGCGSKL